MLNVPESITNIELLKSSFIMFVKLVYCIETSESVV